MSTLAGALLALSALDACADQVMLESFQENEGLTNLSPQCLAQDSGAVLWICTANGLFRFDGFQLHPEALPQEAGSYLYDARADAWGRLWVMAEGGVYLRRESGDGALWTEVLKPDGKHLHVESGQQFELDERGTLYALDDDRLLWTTGTRGPPADRLVVRRLPMPEPQYRPGDIPPLRLRGDALWIGCGRGLCEWQNGRLRLLGAAQGLPEDDWGHLLVSRDGSLWARGSRHLARLSPHSDRFETILAPQRTSVYGNGVTIEDPSGGIVTATDSGIARWDGREWRGWTPTEGLPDTEIRTLVFDAEGSLWLGATGRGVYRWIGYGSVEHWTSASGLPSSVVTDLARDGSGRLWAATKDGVAWFDASARRFRTPRGRSLPAGPVYALAVDGRGDLWWVEKQNLFKVAAGSLEPRIQAHDPSLVAVSQGAGEVYVSGDNGLERLETDAEGLHRSPFGQGRFDPHYNIRLVSGDKQERIVSSGRDLWIQREEGWSELRDTQGMLIDALEATVAQGTLWAAGTDGLGAYMLRETDARQLQFLPKAGFGGATTSFLRAGAAKSLWMGSDRGLFIRSADGTWSRMDRRSGLIWNDITNGFITDADGGVWIGTTAGITHLLPHARPAPAPALRLDEISFGSHPSRSPPSEPVAWADRSLRVTLGTAGFSRARSTRIEYRLATDQPWRTAQAAMIDIGALEPGSHLLEVRAAGLAPLEVAGPVLQMAFDVCPPWWSTIEARVAYAAVIAVFWWLSVWWLRRRDRARRRVLEAAVSERTAALAASQEALRGLGEHNARALEDERKRVSRELHDELGQQLAALRMEVSVAKVRADQHKPGAPSDFTLLLGRVDRLVSTVRTLVSQLRPPALDGGLPAALEWLAAEFTQNTGLPCSLHLDAQARELSPDQATMVFRIAQESLNNVRRHAKARSAALTLAAEDDGWVLTVRDDGLGFDTSRRRPGYGLLGMDERARLLDGRLEVKSVVGGGTEVALRFARVQ